MVIECKKKLIINFANLTYYNSYKNSQKVPTTVLTMCLKPAVDSLSRHVSTQ